MEASGRDPAHAVSVVIPTWRRAPWLAGCLRAVARQSLPAREVIVVGREEDEPAREAVSSLAGSVPGLRWATVAGPGHLRPVLTGLQEASGAIVAFLDDDTEPDPDWLSQLVAPLADPEVACVGGRVIEPGLAARVPRDAGMLRWYGELAMNVTRLERPLHSTDSVMECNWAWRADVLRELEFDPVFDFGEASMYGLDLSLQAKARGHRVTYTPAARVVHHRAPRDDALNRADRPQRVHVYSRNQTYVVLKHLHGIGRIAFFPWWWLVGDPGSPGVLRLPLELVRGHGLGSIGAALSGKREGVRLWRRRER